MKHPPGALFSALCPQSYFLLSGLVNAFVNPATLGTRRPFCSWWPFYPLLAARLLPGHSAPAGSLGGLKTSRRPLGRLVISRTTGPFQMINAHWLLAALLPTQRSLGSLAPS